MNAGTCGQRGPNGARCSRPAGHNGGHKDEARDVYWPEDGDRR